MRRLNILFLYTFVVLTAIAFPHTDVTVQQAHAMLIADPNLIVIDVRELSEYCSTVGHVPGAYNYPYNSGYLQAHYTDFNPADPVMVICRSGSRSNSAANFLDSKGFNTVYDILGGTNTWDDDYPTVSCVDSDKDQINDDLDNLPTVFNPTQDSILRLADFSELAARWQSSPEQGLYMEDLLTFCEHWLEVLP